MILRAGIMFLATAAMALLLPAFFLKGLLWPAGSVAKLLTPYAEQVDARVDDDAQIGVNAVITYPMELLDGSSLAPLSGEWSKQGGDLLGILIVGLAVWMLPALGWRRRLLMLPLMLALLSLVASVDLAVMLQADLFSSAKLNQLLALPLAGSDSNLDVFSDLQKRGEIFSHLAGFMNSGGRLMFAALMGLMVGNWPRAATP